MQWYVETFRPKTIVECGVDQGWSTLTLLRGAHENGTKMVSFDTKFCDAAVLRVQEARLDPHWEFRLGDSREDPEQAIDDIDLLFLDTEHNEDQVLSELRVWEKRMTAESAVFIHDTAIHRGAWAGISRYLWDDKRSPYDDWGSDIKGWFTMTRMGHCGLTILCKEWGPEGIAILAEGAGR